MFKYSCKRYSLIFTVFLLTLFVVGCSAKDGQSEDKSNQETENGQEVELTLVDWDSEIASSHVVAKVLEDLGYDVTITPLDMSLMWESVASGETDGMLAAWLPGDMAAQYEEYGDRVDDLGPNLEQAKIGLVVPEYMDVDSIEDLDSQANKTITGIDPGSGVVTAAEDAIEEYSNLEGWEVQVSSSGAMVSALSQAYENEEEIIVTGWSPHWKFAAFDLKYLDDPKEVFGGEQYIGTMVRKGLKEDMPEVYQVLDNFYWTAEDMESVMLDISEGMSPNDAAEKWVEDNQDKVSEWTEGIQ